MIDPKIFIFSAVEVLASKQGFRVEFEIADVNVSGRIATLHEFTFAFDRSKTIRELL